MVHRFFVLGSWATQGFARLSALDQGRPARKHWFLFERAAAACPFKGDLPLEVFFFFFPIDGNYAEPQAMTPLRHGSADAGTSPASSAEACKSAHDACPGQVPLDECSHKHTALAVESFGRLEKSRTENVDQLIASIVRAAASGDLRKKGVVKVRLQQIISVTTLVAFSRRMEWYRWAVGATRREAYQNSAPYFSPDDCATRSPDWGGRLWVGFRGWCYN